jgi:hypothetical protein
MKPSELLFRAAQLVDKRNRRWSTAIGCCKALNVVSVRASYQPHATAYDYLHLFSNRDVYWFGHPYSTPSRQERVMCLLLASEIARSEGR